ncbi:uncharacterized protein LOC120144857 [Hibiscus syriacus]|uniref:uncharacterized protein LOC120144857 n=1 Tax=Hibiscus syriacus TaxID=106335 RepID=UPI001921F566|nr:uncharacterized protein LOC120144857 [Hibiscus syriacus]
MNQSESTAQPEVHSTARVYNLKTSDDSEIIAGTFHIAGKFVLVLINPGSNYSYISSKLVRDLSLPLEPIRSEMIVRNPFGNKARIYHYYANVNCRVKRVQVTSLDGVEVSMVSERINPLANVISLTSARKLMLQGRKVYISNIVDKSVKEKKFEDIPTVREFSEVFLDELPGLPPDMEVEFQIEVMLLSKKSFETLKKVLTEAPVLVQPKSSKEFTIFSDNSHNGLGCVLMQVGKAIACASRQLTPHEKNYLTCDLELPTVVILNLTQRRWMELLKDYDAIIDYYPAKANIVADALSRKTFTTLRSLDARIVLKENDALMAELMLKPFLLERIKELQKKDDKCLNWFEQVEIGGLNDFEVPSGLLQHIPISQWKWENITMDFVIGLPSSSGKKDSIWVIVDHLTKSTHFILVRIDFSMEKYVELYVKEIVRLHGVPISIVSDRVPKILEVLARSFRRYRSNPAHIITPDEMEIHSNLTYDEDPVQILAFENKQLQNKMIPLVKVL